MLNLHKEIRERKENGDLCVEMNVLRYSLSFSLLSRQQTVQAAERGEFFISLLIINAG